MKPTDPFRKKMKARYCRVELIESKSTPYLVEFIGHYRSVDNILRMQGTKITVASHRCRYSELQNIIDQWIDEAKLPNDL